MSNRRKNARQHRSASAGDAPTRDHHSHTGLGFPVAGQVIHLQADQGALDDGQLTVVAVGLFGRNPEMITRRPSYVTATRQTRSTMHASPDVRG